MSAISDTISFKSTPGKDCSVTVTFSVPAEAVNQAYAEAVKAAVKHAQLPGFRPGKAPAAMVKSRYKNYIVEDVERNVQGAAFEKLSSDKSLDLVAFGAIDAKVKPEEGKEYSFTLDAEAAPEIKLPSYKDIKVDVKPAQTVEKRAEDRLEYMKQLYSDYVPVEGAIKKDDMVKVSYTSDLAVADDASEPVKRAAKSDESWLWINEPEQFPGMLKALENAEIGKEYDFACEYPADWREKDLAGKKVNYKFKLHEGQRKVPCASNEKLAERLKAESVEKMLEDVRKAAEKEIENEVKEEKKSKVLAAILEKTPEFTLPKRVLDSAVQKEFSRIADRLVRSEKDVEEFKANKDKHLEDAKKDALASMRKFFILRAIAAIEKITVSEKEIDEQISAMSRYMGRKEEEIRQVLSRNGADSEIESDILMNKVLAFVADNAKA